MARTCAHATASRRSARSPQCKTHGEDVHACAAHPHHKRRHHEIAPGHHGHFHGALLLQPGQLVVRALHDCFNLRRLGGARLHQAVIERLHHCGRRARLDEGELPFARHGFLLRAARNAFQRYFGGPREQLVDSRHGRGTPRGSLCRVAKNKFQIFACGVLCWQASAIYMDDETPLNDAVLDERAVVALMCVPCPLQSNADARRKQDPR